MQNKIKQILFLLIAIVLIASTCAKPKQVLRKGVLMSEDRAASLDWAEVKRTLKKKNPQESITRLELFIKSYPTHELSATALYNLARIYSKTKNRKKTISTLEILIERFPLSDPASDAKSHLAKLYLDQKMYQEAKAVLSAIDLDKLSTEKRLKVLKRLRKALQATDSWKELIYCDLQIYDNTTEFAQISEIKSEVFWIIEHRLSPDELYELVEKRKERYPGDIALWKLARIAYHVREYKNARDYLTYFLKTYPLSEYLRDAEMLYDRLISRKSPDNKIIGVMLPLSGPYSSIGESALRGIWLASGLFNVNKTKYDKYKIVIKDTMSDPDRAARAFDELALDARVIGIIGPMLNKPAQVIALKAQEYGLPVILLNQDQDITQVGDFVFRNLISNREQAKVLADFAVNKLGIKRFGFLYPDHSYGRSFTDAFWDRIDEYPDTEVRGVESYDPRANDFSKPIKKLFGLYSLKYRQDEICHGDTQKNEDDQGKKQCYEPQDLPPAIDMEALIIPDNYEKIIQIAPSLAYHDIEAIQLIGGNLWNSNNLFIENTGQYLQGSIFTDAFFNRSKDPRVQKFTAEYFEEFNEEPGILSNHSFEAASIMLQALEASRPTDGENLKKTLAGRTFSTAGGDVSFNDDRNLIHNLSILVIDGNEIKELY